MTAPIRMRASPQPQMFLAWITGGIRAWAGRRPGRGDHAGCGGPGGAPGPEGELRAADRAQEDGPWPHPATALSPAGPPPEATRAASCPERPVHRAQTGEKYRLMRPAPGSGPRPRGPRIAPMV